MTSTWIASRPSLFVAFAAWLIIITPGLHAGDWKIDTVDGGGTATFTSLRIDTAGNVHVAYVVDDGNLSAQVRLLGRLDKTLVHDDIG